MSRPPSATWITCSMPVAAAIQLLPPSAMLHYLSTKVHGKSLRPLSTLPCFMAARHGGQMPLTPSACDTPTVRWSAWRGPSDQLLLKLSLHDVTAIFHCCRLHWLHSPWIQAAQEDMGRMHPQWCGQPTSFWGRSTIQGCMEKCCLPQPRAAYSAVMEAGEIWQTAY